MLIDGTYIEIIAMPLKGMQHADFVHTEYTKTQPPISTFTFTVISKDLITLSISKYLPKDI